MGKLRMRSSPNRPRNSCFDIVKKGIPLLARTAVLRDRAENETMIANPPMIVLHIRRELRDHNIPAMPDESGFAQPEVPLPISN